MVNEGGFGVEDEVAGEVFVAESLGRCTGFTGVGAGW